MAASSYQSLYRRYRPQRFSEVLGQDHVTRALRNAVREERIGHAYLFSGPRGTGKTSTARILAKVLNCAAPKDGEPCGECANCQAVERGQVTDWLLEQDAASKSKVDDMRDLLDRVPLGTSGNRKVIILDEVHMLSQGAENALLKTLEEPPDHVVFVLATTDPQKVRPTILSRTQHFTFHLLSSDVVADHVRHVIEDAALSLDDKDDAISYVVRVGGGSARDTLSALDQVAALGEVMADSQPVDAILDAVVAHDAGAVLVAVADAMATGRDPRGLGEALIGRLRDAFLAVMGASDDHLPTAERARAAEVGEQLGAAGLTRALEVLGEALTELSRKPDPRIVVEVALVRLTRPDVDRSLDAVVARLERLEEALRSGGGLPPAAAPASSVPPESPPGAAMPNDPQPSPVSADSLPAEPPAGRGSGAARGARAALAASRPAASKPNRTSRTTPVAPPSATPPEPPPSATAPQATRDAPSATAPQAAQDPPPATGQAKLDAPSATRPQATLDPLSSVTGPQTTQDLPPSAAPSALRSAVGQATMEPPANAATPPPEAETAPPAPASAATPPAASAPAELAAVTQAWSSKILGELPISVRSKWRGGTWVEPLSDGVARFAVDNEWHQRACEAGRRDVERLLAAHFGAPLRVAVVVEGGGGERSKAGSPASDGDGAADADDFVKAEIGDVTALPDANDVATGGVDLLLREFGGQLVEEDPT